MVSVAIVTKKTHGLTDKEFSLSMKDKSFYNTFSENESKIAYNAAAKNDVKTLKRLHKFGTNFNTGNFVRGVSKRPIYVAASKGNHEAVMFLVRAGADVHPDHDGHNPEMIARKNGHVKTADYLKRRK